MQKLLLIAGALALAKTVTPAFAHGDDEVDTHARDHQEHAVTHHELAEAHARAHEDGFESRWEHRRYHRALRAQHEEFHEEHPNTRHDHRRWWNYWNR